MDEILKKYREWKFYKDIDYIQDEIEEFFFDLSRAEKQEIMEYLDKLIP